MIQKKVCMLGAFATGKTSLVSRFVWSVFSERYLTTVGVKIDRKQMRWDDHDLSLILWDLHGEDPFLLALNKSDLVGEWEVADEAVAVLAARGWRVHRTSARTGAAVEDAFLDLGRRMMGGRDG